MISVAAGIGRAFSQSPLEVLLTVRMCVLLLLVEVPLHLCRLERVSELMGVAIDGVSSTPAPARTYRRVVLSVREKRALRCVRRALRLVPRRRGQCLREALLTGHVLRGRSPTLVLGILESGERFIAHAWIEVDGVAIGRPAPHRFLAGPLAETPGR